MLLSSLKRKIFPAIISNLVVVGGLFLLTIYMTYQSAISLGPLFSPSFWYNYSYYWGLTCFITFFIFYLPLLPIQLLLMTGIFIYQKHVGIDHKKSMMSWLLLYIVNIACTPLFFVIEMIIMVLIYGLLPIPHGTLAI
jgi:hypothetical protein